MICIECGSVSNTELCDNCMGETNRPEAVSLDMARQHDMSISCAACQRVIFSDSKQCSNCRKSYHQTCDSSDGNTLNGFMCSACNRRNQMFSEDMMLSASAAPMRDHHAPLSPFSDPIGSQINLQMPSNSMTSSYPSHPDFGMDMYSQMTVSSVMHEQHQIHVQQMMMQSQIMEEISDGGATNDSDRNSSPFFQESSDYDEDFVPTSTRGRGRGSGGKKKPGRGQSSGTRRQTNPGPTGFFSATQLRTMGDFPQPTTTRGKRGKRGNGTATPRQPGKGPGRGRGRGRGSSSQIAAALQQQQQIQYGSLSPMPMMNPIFNPVNPQSLQMNAMGIQMMPSTSNAVLQQNTTPNVPSIPLPSNIVNQTMPPVPLQLHQAPQTPVPPPAVAPPPEALPPTVPNFEQMSTDAIREVDETMMEEDNTEESEEQSEEQYSRMAVVCRANDEFLQKASMCLNCGSIGKGVEGSMIACLNCAQTYHTYCVLLHEKINSAIMTHGWRCLDCTICEGCGKGGDDKNLMLCDECDVPYHTYCLKPPIEKVPTGSWRCQWCSRCRRCNHKVSSGSELTARGLCHPCDSLQHCARCRQGYQLNDKLIRCSQCNKWEHGRCEGLYTDEQLEQAALNRMRCAACRPNRIRNNGLSDVDTVWCDSIALDKDAHEILKSQYTPSALKNHILDAGYRESFDHYDDESAALEDMSDPMNSFPTTSTGQRGRGRGNPSGRRGMNRIGVGGFYAKLPRHRIQALNDEAAAAAAEEDDPKKPKRPRKPRRSQLEDAYPPQIQEAFFGMKSVDGKTLVDTAVDEPELADFDNLLDEQKIPMHILCRDATEMLRNDIMENECLDNMDLGTMENDLDDMDLSLLFDGDEENEAQLEDSLQGDTDMKEDRPEGSFGPTTFNLDQKPSTSSGSLGGPPEGMQSGMGMGAAHFAQKAAGVRAAMSRSGSQTDASDRYQFSARWEEDEPHGLRATTAAVLYANEKHDGLKLTHPVWSERVKQIQKLWRNLSSDERQEYVNRARDNRTKSGSKPRPRRTNVHSTNSVDSPTNNSPAPHQFGFKVPVNPMGSSFAMHPHPPPPSHSSASSSSFPTPSAFGAPLEPPPQPKQIAITCHLDEKAYIQYQELKRVKHDREKLNMSLEEQLNKARKQKKNLAAKKRQMVKTQTAAPDYDGRAIDLNDSDQQIMTQLTDQIKATQSEMEASRRELRNHDSVLQNFESAHDILRNESSVTQAMIDASKSRDASYAIQLEQALAQQSQSQSQGLGQVPNQGPPGPPGSFPLMQQQQPRMMHMQGMPMMRPGPQTSFMVRPQMNIHQPQELMYRRMPQMRQIRAVLGGVRYEEIKDDPIMKDVYECLDNVTFEVHLRIEGPKEGQHLIQGHPPPHIVQRMMQHPGAPGPPGPRLIMPGSLPPGQIPQLNPGKPLPLPPPPITPQSAQPPQPPPVPQQPLPQLSEDGPKPKKKRTQQKKTTTTFPTGGEYDAWIEAMRARFRLCPRMPQEQRDPPLDTVGAEFVDYGLTTLSTMRGRKPLIGDFGEMSVRNGTRLFGNGDRKRKSLTFNDVNLYQVEPPIRLVALYNNTKPITEDEIFQDDMDEKTCLNPNAVLQKLFNKRQVSREHIRCRSRYNEEAKAPLQPERTMFFEEGEEEEEEDVTVELVFNTNDLSQESSAEDKMYLCSKLQEQIKELLSIKDELPLKIEDTPPDSPASISPEPELSESARQTTSRAPSVSAEKEIKREEDDDMPAAPIFREIKEEDVDTSQPQNCRQCQQLIDGGVSLDLRFRMDRLGILPFDATNEERDEIVCFCSKKCYYECMSLSRIPLTDEELNSAEQYVNEETYNRLKQIISDSIVKAINQGKKPPGTSASSSSLLANADLLISPRDTRYMMDEGRREHITFVPVSSLIGASDAKKEQEIQRVAAGVEWKHYTQEICDSFVRLNEQHQNYIMTPKIGVPPPPYELDKRICVFCGGVGDGESDKCGRLISFTEYYWVHVNCALWSSEVFENPNTGSLTNVDLAVVRAAQTICEGCHQPGASVKCHKMNCGANYHILCAMNSNGCLVRNRLFICKLHEKVHPSQLETNFVALRKIYVKRDENQMLARLFDLSDGQDFCLRLGAFTFYRLGSLTPNQIKRFHNKTHIFPNNYRVTRLFWSPRNRRERMMFECTIEEHNNQPSFIVRSLDDPTVHIRSSTATKAWAPIFDRINKLRDREQALLKFFGSHVSGETLFGLNEGAVIKITESLPGLDTILAYNKRNEKSPILELPLAINQMGCARAEPRSRTIGQNFRAKPQPMGGTHRSHGVIRPSNNLDQPSSSSSCQNETFQSRQASTSLTSANSGRSRGVRSFYTAATRNFGLQSELVALSLQMENTKNTQAMFSAYQQMRREWKDRVLLARSQIAGLGLYAKKAISMGEYIIEYKGEVIRSEVCEVREKRYIAQNRGVYQFRIDENWVVDATMSGGVARYINHSCDPNCSTEILPTGGGPSNQKIIIMANRPISEMEELTYNYNFDLEDPTDKIPCLCGAPNCVKWMN
ncbi:unnamed protein product [Caenorhabditis brenneri]